MADNQRQQATLDELEPLIQSKIEISHRIIAARRSKGLEVASAIVASGEGKHTMDAIRGGIGRMLAEERRLLAVRADRSRRIAEASNFEFIVISVFDILAVLAALWIIFYNTRKRREAELRLADQRRAYDTEARAAARSGEQARIATERAALLRDQLLNNLYHELRTPLTSILGFSDMISTDETVDPDTREAGLSIHRNGERLMAIIENLLQVTEAAASGKPAPSEPVQVNPVVRSVVQQMRPEIDAKNIGVEVNAPENPRALINGDRFRRILQQLIGNAIKFSEPGGGVRIDVAESEKRVRVSIRDEGPGIAKEKLPHLFEGFRQGDGSSTRPHGGLGTGLFIARFLVETYGGTLAAESEGEGRGARFTLTLPAAEVLNGPQQTLSPSV